MAVVYHSNNQLLPANQRNADVAEFALRKIAPVMQQRNMTAFRVQGIEACLYNHITAGRICSCQGKHKKINSRLNKDGKADEGFINKILTGTSFGTSQFGVDDSTGAESYVPDTAANPKYDSLVLSPQQQQVQMDDELVSLDDIVGNFDAVALGITDSACPVCYGTGFVGGFTLYNGYRKVVPCEDFALPAQAELRVQNSPFSVVTNFASVKLYLPKNAIAIDSFRLLNKMKLVDAVLFIDGKKADYKTVLSACDGKEHTITILSDIPIEFTHLEVQLNLSKESVFMEVPRLTKSSNLTVIDSTEPFQILLSPNIPHADKLDIVTESMWGKALMIQDVSWHNTKERQMLGWECNARVIQPQELYNFLPRRQRVATKQQTTNAAIGNMFTRF